jgi:hypothetical protein
MTGPKEPVKYKDPVRLHMVLLNVSPSAVTMHSSDFNYAAEVTDESGTIIQPEFVPPYEGPRSGIFWTLEPGYKLTTYDVLPSGYRAVMKPGKYTIRLAFIQSPKDGPRDWSNNIEVHVVP